MRRVFGVLHRWAGLSIAAFLFVSGITGAVISWDHELDEWLNPHLTAARTAGSPRDALALARELEQHHPSIQVTSVPLAAERGRSLAFRVEGKVNPATGNLYEPGFNQVFVDPASGRELGKREWGAVWPVTTENVVSFLYVLHYSLHIPAFGGNDRWGPWLLGGIAAIWAIDCFIGFYLTLPQRRRTRAARLADDIAGEAQVEMSRSFWQRWRPAWRVRWSGGATKLNFDLHRAFSLWTWLVLFIIAFTAFSLNLYREAFIPAMSLVSNITPSPFDVRTPTRPNKPIAPAIDYEEALRVARAQAAKRGWAEPAGNIFYARTYGIYGVSFFRPGDGHDARGVGRRELYVDGQDGRVLGELLPWKGTAADVFVQAQFPLHSGRILGLPGRILISAIGLIVAMLSVTGVTIWLKKRRARLQAAARPASRTTSGGVLEASR